MRSGDSACPLMGVDLPRVGPSKDSRRSPWLVIGTDTQRAGLAGLQPVDFSRHHRHSASSPGGGDYSVASLASTPTFSTRHPCWTATPNQKPVQSQQYDRDATLSGTWMDGWDVGLVSFSSPLLSSALLLTSAPPPDRISLTRNAN